MDIASFLKRICLQSLPESPLERLQALHRAMTQSVPFENLAILEGRKISLEPEAVYAKVVEQGRGGYCFELNSLLAQALESLGYRVERLLGRVWAGGAPAPLPTHMTLRVTVDNRPYLCDVGFGAGTLREPLPWEPGAIMRQSPDSFRLAGTDNGETMLARLAGDSWQDQYSILPCTVRAQDYIPANHYTSTHPDSFFTRFPMAALNNRDGRVTLRGRTLRRVGRDGEIERKLASFEELMRVLSEDFGLHDLDVKALEGRLAALFSE